MNDQHGDCVTCGFPRYRPEGHAEWCERVAEWCREENYARRHATYCVGSQDRAKEDEITCWACGGDFISTVNGLVPTHAA